MRVAIITTRTVWLDLEEHYPAFFSIRFDIPFEDIHIGRINSSIHNYSHYQE